MRFVIQRVREAALDVDGRPFSSIGPGFVALVGYSADELRPEKLGDSERSNARLTEKMLGLRVFPDKYDKMNEDLESFGGELLLVSQFTLYADCRKGKRPSFHTAAPADVAEKAYDKLVEDLRGRLPGRVQTGRFGANMDIRLTNWGPVTIILDSADF